MIKLATGPNELSVAKKIDKITTLGLATDCVLDENRPLWLNTKSPGFITELLFCKQSLETKKSVF
jgi:hypothetical protein